MTATHEAAWRRRFRAPRISLPDWARDAADRLTYASNASGKWEVYAWDRAMDAHRQVTDRPLGTRGGALDPTGEWIWWFDDQRGNELRRWMVEAFGGGQAHLAAPELRPACSAGLALGRSLAAIGSSDDRGVAVDLVRDGEVAHLYSR